MSSCLESGVDFTWSKMKPLAGERNRREVLSSKLDGFNDCVSAMSPSDLACLPPEELDKALLALIILYQSTSAGGAIDNKIEQAMDLVKSHLLFAVREEVEVLKVQIKELAEKNEQLQRENAMLRQNHGPAQGTAQPQGAPMGIQQQTMPQQQPTSHPQGIPQQQYTTTGGAQGQTLPPPQQQGQTLPPPQGQLQGAPTINMPQQGIPQQQQAAPHPQGMPQQQPTAQLQMSQQQQPAPSHLQQQTSQSIPMQQQQHSIPGSQQTAALSQAQHGVAPSQQPVQQHSQQQQPTPKT